MLSTTCLMFHTLHVQRCPGNEVVGPAQGSLREEIVLGLSRKCKSEIAIQNIDQSTLGYVF